MEKCAEKDDVEKAAMILPQLDEQFELLKKAAEI